MLPVLTELAPALKAQPTAWLTHNILCAPPHYKSAAHYSYAHTLLPPGPVSAGVLGLHSPSGSMPSRGSATGATARPRTARRSPPAAACHSMAA
jgi:hypothetical protein